MRLSRQAGAAVVALLLVTGACSSGGDDSADDATATTAGASTTAAGAEPGSTGGGERFEVPADRMAAIEAAGLTFTEVEYPTQPDGVPWPTEEWPVGELDAATQAAVDAVIDRAFNELSDDTGTIDAVLAVQGGEMVVEAYDGWDPDETHNSWSMAKSVTQALVGIMVRDGMLDPFARAEVPEWSNSADPRHEITLDQLLRMSSGLEWGEDYSDPSGDVLTVLGHPDRGAFAASKPLSVPPDTEWKYSTGTSNIVSRLVRDTLPEGEVFIDWIEAELLTPLGIDEVDPNLDGIGNINGGSWFNLRPEDFARFGLLYLRNGEWDGQRIVPDGWVDYARMPTFTNPDGTYGAHWWIDDRWPGAFAASGFNGQSITILPTDDLVVVVLSEVPDSRDGEVRDALIEALTAG